MTAVAEKGSTAGPKFSPSRFCWESLNRADAEELWSELIDWVGWLRVRYELGSVIPGCWYRHTRMVEELTALMTAHRAAYDDSHTSDGQYWSDMAAWHVHYLRPFLSTIKDLGTKPCGPDTFSARPRAVPGFHGVADWVIADVEARPTGSTAARPATLTPGEVRELVRNNEAAPLDPTDPDTGYSHNGHRWFYDQSRKVFVAQTITST